MRGRVTTESCGSRAGAESASADRTPDPVERPASSMSGIRDCVPTRQVQRVGAKGIGLSIASKNHRAAPYDTTRSAHGHACSDVQAERTRQGCNVPTLPQPGELLAITLEIANLWTTAGLLSGAGGADKNFPAAAASRIRGGDCVAVGRLAVHRGRRRGLSRRGSASRCQADGIFGSTTMILDLCPAFDTPVHLTCLAFR
jgi:hypothetical protein